MQPETRWIGCGRRFTCTVNEEARTFRMHRRATGHPAESVEILLNLGAAEAVLPLGSGPSEILVATGSEVSTEGADLRLGPGHGVLLG